MGGSVERERAGFKGEEERHVPCQSAFWLFVPVKATPGEHEGRFDVDQERRRPVCALLWTRIWACERGAVQALSAILYLDLSREMSCLEMGMWDSWDSLVQVGCRGDGYTMDRGRNEQEGLTRTTVIKGRRAGGKNFVLD